MPRVTATCTCATCGKKFERTTTKCNWKEGYSWIEWAESTFDECTECYKKRMEKERENEPVTVGVYPLTGGQPRIISIRLSGNTKPHKEELKKAGYRWKESAPANAFDELDFTKKPEYHWEKCYKANYHDDVKETVAEINAWLKAERESLNELVGGIEVKKDYTSFEKLILKEFVCGLSTEIKEEQERKKEIDKLTKPVKPDCLPEGYWNGKVYGGKGKRQVYVDGKAKSISEEEAATLMAYAKELEEYKENIKKIK